MRSVFIGGTKRGYVTLRALIERECNIVGVISLEQDAHEQERYENSIRELASQYHIPLYQTKWMRDRDYGVLVNTEWKADIVIGVGCRILFPRAIYEQPPLGCVGVHDSLLPAYRGFAPLNWAILNGEVETGITLFYLSDLMDGGDIIAQRTISIGPNETAPEVYERVCAQTVELILQFYPLLATGNAPRIKQRYDEGSFTCARNPLDGWIEWNRGTLEIHNQIRALTAPYPGAFTVYRGQLLKIWSAGSVPGPRRFVGRIPGRVVAVSASQGHVDVLTHDGVLRLFEVQLEGHQRTAAANVVKSVRESLGFRPTDLLRVYSRALATPDSRS